MSNPNDDEEDPSGFKEDARALKNSQIKSIRLGNRLSASIISIHVVRGNHRRGTAASVELRNLAEHDMGEDVYDAEEEKIDYQALSSELRERVDALIEHSVRPTEYEEMTEDGVDTWENDVEIERRHDRD